MFSFYIKLIHYFRMALFITIIFLMLPRLCKKKGPNAIVYIYTMAIRVLFPSVGYSTVLHVRSPLTH